MTGIAKKIKRDVYEAKSTTYNASSLQHFIVGNSLPKWPARESSWLDKHLNRIQLNNLTRKNSENYNKIKKNLELPKSQGAQHNF